MTERRGLFAITMVVLLFSGVRCVWSQAGLRELPQGKWWKVQRIVRELDLSADQQRRIEEIWSQNRRSLIELKAQLDRSHLDLSELLAQHPIDEAAALKAFEESAAARQAIDRATLMMRIRIKNLLMPEQQERFENLSIRLRGARPLGRGGVAAPAARKPAEKPPQ